MVAAVEKAVQKWYDEIDLYDETDPSNSNALHFTQLVWRSSVQLGISVHPMTMSGHTGWLVVAHFNPPGNVYNNYAENVSPICDEQTTTTVSTSDSTTTVQTTTTTETTSFTCFELTRDEEFTVEDLAHWNTYDGGDIVGTVVKHGYFIPINRTAENWILLIDYPFEGIVESWGQSDINFGNNAFGGTGVNLVGKWPIHDHNLVIEVELQYTVSKDIYDPSSYMSEEMFPAELRLCLEDIMDEELTTTSSTTISTTAESTEADVTFTTTAQVTEASTVSTTTTATEKSTTVATTTEGSTTGPTSTESSTPLASTTGTTTPEGSTTEASTTEASTTEASTTEASTTEASTTVVSTTEGSTTTEDSTTTEEPTTVTDATTTTEVRTTTQTIVTTTSTTEEPTTTETTSTTEEPTTTETTTTEEPTTTVQTTTTVIATTTTMLDDPRPPSFQIDIKLQLTVPWDDDLSNTASAAYINYAAELTAWITEILTPVLEENNLDLYVGIIFIEPKTKNRRRRAADSLVTKFKLVFWQRSQLSQVFRSASLGALGATVSGQVIFRS